MFTFGRIGNVSCFFFKGDPVPCNIDNPVSRKTLFTSAWMGMRGSLLPHPTWINHVTKGRWTALLFTESLHNGSCHGAFLPKNSCVRFSMQSLPRRTRGSGNIQMPLWSCFSRLLSLSKVFFLAECELLVARPVLLLVKNGPVALSLRNSSSDVDVGRVE